MAAPFAINTAIAHVDTPLRGAENAGPDIHDGLPSMGEVVEESIVSANKRANFAGELANAFAAGVRDDIHGTMIAASKADIELRVLGAVRNKVIDAFYELWRMQI